MAKVKDCYRILRVPRDAEATTIKAAYRRLALRYHPDVARTPGARERFIEIQEAAQVLLDPDLRRVHGNTLRPGGRRPRIARRRPERAVRRGAGLAVDLLGIRIAARLETLDVVDRRSHAGRGRQGSRRPRKGWSKAR